MPKYNPNIQKPNLQPKSSGIFWSRMGGVPPHLTPEQAERYFYTNIISENCSDTGFLVADCGCELKREYLLRIWKVNNIFSWTNKYACKNHLTICNQAGCPHVVCVCGNADGFEVEKGTGEFYCTDHYDEALKEYKKQKRREWWAGFFEGFFGGEE